MTNHEDNKGIYLLKNHIHWYLFTSALSSFDDFGSDRSTDKYLYLIPLGLAIEYSDGMKLILCISGFSLNFIYSMEFKAVLYIYLIKEET